MSIRYRAAVALTLAATLGSLPAAAKSSHHAKGRKPGVPSSVSELYSRRALNRTKIILQLEMLELRSEHLERVRRAIEQHLPVDQLLKI